VSPKAPEEPYAPGEPVGDDDSWEPPSPALGGPGQLLATLVVTAVVAVILLGALAAVTWLFR
jgi:hypothetical protein